MTGPTEESTTAGVYGVIIGAAVMASSHAASAGAVIAAVLVTLVVYWSAERYARIVAQRIHERRRLHAREVRLQLTTGWEIVTASTLPAAVLVGLTAVGVALRTAVISALVCSALLLCVAGWEAGRHGQLTPLERLVSAAVAGAFGVVMVLLKVTLH
ncbi:hypothetical protein [Dactylosporangium aurantiacum]|uniref:hypothetical protein n=1 Tax=Dactylosporangium aurantiacum TaxID=35754 RepID=UPI00052474EC|nr:hypothetical protein [Dactylosporangium aurantiacum]MDG6107485.1 hypothetical protein [Dactylosporangium aurantiacum]